MMEEHRSTSMAAIVVFLFMMACCTGTSSAQALSPGPSSFADDCMTNLLNMSDCLSYVTAGSNVTVPDKPCCPELAGLVDSNPLCLCQLLGKSDTYGIKIDVNRALKLPSVCRITTPPVSLCSAAGIPVGAPLASQGPMSPEGGLSGTPSASQVPMSPGVQPPDGLDANPSTKNNNNGAASGNNEGSFLGILVGFALAFLI